MPDIVKILCVEDEPDIRALIEIALGHDPDFVVCMMASAADALALLTKQEWIPDLALVDMLMPEMTGTDLMFAMRALPGLATIPIIFLTASVWAKQATNYTSVGAVAVIEKPFDPWTLAKTVREHWNKIN